MPDKDNHHSKSAFDKKMVFYFVFSITVLSTLLVALACILTGQSLLNSAFYTLITMWIMGVLSQLLIQNLYRVVVHPLEMQREEEIARQLWEYEPESIEEANIAHLKGKK